MVTCITLGVLGGELGGSAAKLSATNATSSSGDNEMTGALSGGKEIGEANAGGLIGDGTKMPS